MLKGHLAVFSVITQSMTITNHLKQLWRGMKMVAFHVEMIVFIVLCLINHEVRHSKHKQ